MSVPGNILGSLRAEADREMLKMAFLETADSSALTKTTDFNIVVGRRGTGKSALFAYVNKFFKNAPKTWVHKEVPLEHSALETQSILKEAGCDYRIGRAVARLLWRAYILTTVGRLIISNYKLRSSDLKAYFQTHSLFFKKETCYDYMNVVLKNCSSDVPTALPSKIAALLNIADLETLVRESLTKIQGKSVLLFDSLDEGWQPTEIPTALLGGLATAASDLNDADISIHVVAFVRDNMFRALAHFDQDFSRHIEGSTLRLRWELNSLFHLVAKRIRIGYGIGIAAESDVKAWNRFAKRGIEGRAGFEICLRSTLYRPRDIIGLLNRAYIRSKREGREQIIDEDIESVARMISTERLDDLLKEYNVVLPGLRLFIGLFRGKSATWTYRALISFLDQALQEEKYEEQTARDFAILGSGGEIFFALYSVGFFGVSSSSSTSFAFCHDGALSEIADLEKDASIAIHPCYWRALDIAEDTPPITLLTQIYDDDQDKNINLNVRDQRMKLLGQVVEELPRLDSGKDSASTFEVWVQRAVQILFTGHLSNVELHSSPDGVQRRDVVATNTARGGFWKRVYDDYGARQVVFEVKNYADLKPEDYRQALSYGGDEYGRITFMVYRSQNEGANDNERSHILDIYRHKHLVVLLPANILSRCLSKLRSRDASIYWEHALSKRLDTHVRSYLSIKSAARYKKKTRKKKG